MGTKFAHKLNRDLHPRALRWVKTSEKIRPGVEPSEYSMKGKYAVNQLLMLDEEEDLGEACYFSDEVKEEFYDDIVKKHRSKKRKVVKGKAKAKGQPFMSNVAGSDHRQLTFFCNALYTMMEEIRERVYKLEANQGKSPSTPTKGEDEKQEVSADEEESGSDQVSEQENKGDEVSHKEFMFSHLICFIITSLIFFRKFVLVIMFGMGLIHHRRTNIGNPRRILRRH